MALCKLLYVFCPLSKRHIDIPKIVDCLKVKAMQSSNNHKMLKAEI